MGNAVNFLKTVEMRVSGSSNPSLGAKIQAVVLCHRLYFLPNIERASRDELPVKQGIGNAL